MVGGGDGGALDVVQKLRERTSFGPFRVQNLLNERDTMEL